MEIKYFNSNFDKITQNKDTDQSITNVIEKIPSLNIISDKNLLQETIKISKQFKRECKLIQLQLVLVETKVQEILLVLVDLIQFFQL